MLFSTVTVTHPAYHYRVIARPFRAVAISRYNVSICIMLDEWNKAVGDYNKFWYVRIRKVVPGDCHVTAL